MSLYTRILLRIMVAWAIGLSLTYQIAKWYTGKHHPAHLPAARRVAWVGAGTYLALAALGLLRANEWRRAGNRAWQAMVDENAKFACDKGQPNGKDAWEKFWLSLPASNFHFPNAIAETGYSWTAKDGDTVAQCFGPIIRQFILDLRATGLQVVTFISPWYGHIGELQFWAFFTLDDYPQRRSGAAASVSFKVIGKTVQAQVSSWYTYHNKRAGFFDGTFSWHWSDRHYAASYFAPKSGLAHQDGWGALFWRCLPIVSLLAVPGFVRSVWEEWPFAPAGMRGRTYGAAWPGEDLLIESVRKNGRIPLVPRNDMQSSLDMLQRKLRGVVVDTLSRAEQNG